MVNIISFSFILNLGTQTNLKFSLNSLRNLSIPVILVCCEAGTGVLNWEYADYDQLNEEAQPTHSELAGSSLSIWAPTLGMWNILGLFWFSFWFRCSFSTPTQWKQSHKIYYLKIPEVRGCNRAIGRTVLHPGQEPAGDREQAS